MKTFDPHCYDLAKLFLDDREPVSTEAQVNSLASVIQTAIEDWLDNEDTEAEDSKQAAYDSYIDSKIDEWKETGVRPVVRRMA